MTLTDLGLPMPTRPLTVGMPADGPLLDTYGRVATDLRVSLTDRCNLRCTYCMPAEGLDWLPDNQLLDADELARLLRIAVTRLGITSVRFTGGEPLVNQNLERAIAAAAALRPRAAGRAAVCGGAVGRRPSGQRTRTVQRWSARTASTRCSPAATVAPGHTTDRVRRPRTVAPWPTTLAPPAAARLAAR